MKLSPILFSLAWTLASPAAARTLDTCFSPLGHCDQVLVSWIDSSLKTLDGAIYNLTDPGITEALIRVKKRSVRVRIVKNVTASLTEENMLNRLRAGGVEVHVQKGTGGGLQHNKFLIIDSKYVVTGSFNWTRAAARRNDENFVVLDDQAPKFQKEFDRLWSP